jgi:hypothetical protein
MLACRSCASISNTSWHSAKVVPLHMLQSIEICPRICSLLPEAERRESWPQSHDSNGAKRHIHYSCQVSRNEMREERIAGQ